MLEEGLCDPIGIRILQHGNISLAILRSEIMGAIMVPIYVK